MEIKNDLNQIIKDNKFVLLDFYAEWCQPCQMLLPLMEKVEAKFPNVKVVKVNVDIDVATAGHYGVTSIPSVFFLKSGKIVDSFIGFKNEKQLEDFINKNTK